MARGVRALNRAFKSFSVPAPRVLVRPALGLVLAVRGIYYFIVRVFICEPLFKAYCREYGRNLHTDVFFHWVSGRGDIIAGDDVTFDGKISIAFGARYCDRPTLRVGSRTIISDDVRLTIGREVVIGSDCLIAAGVMIFDASGHPIDPEARRAKQPPNSEDVRPVSIENNVWIGRNAIIHPGVTVGQGSIVSAGAVVMTDVPAFSIVAGNPARKIGKLDAPDPSSPANTNPAS